MGNDFWFSVGIMFLVTWSLAWKGVALWKAARNNQLLWFISILLVNAVGIVEIIYISFFQKKPVNIQS